MEIPFFKEDLIRKGLLVFIASLSGGMVAFFANLIIANMLLPTSTYSFGMFKTIIYLFTFLPSIIDLGISTSLTKYVAEFKEYSKKKHVIRWFLKIKFVAYVFLILAIFLFKDYIAFYFTKDVSNNYLVIAGTFLAISSFFTTFNAIVLGLKNFKLFSLSLFLGSTLPAVFAVLLSSFGIFYMTLGWGIGFIAGSMPNILYLFRKRIFSGYRKVDVKKLFFRFSLPIFPIELTGALFGSIVPLLSLFFSQKLISYYSFAFMFYWAAQLVPSSLSSVMFPTISGLSGLGRHENAKSILRKTFLYYGLFAVIGFIFVLLFSDWFISVVSANYLPSLYMFKVIVSLSFLFGFNVIYASYLKGLGKVKKYALFVLAQNILLLAISFIILSM